MDELFQIMLPTPLGALRLIASETALVGVYFPKHAHVTSIDARDVTDAGRATRPEMLELAATQLTAYFRRQLAAFTIPLAPRGTEFQREVWLALREIPYGQTRSYAELARVVGSPRASRAVGAANGRNPLSIVVPCHRVIGSNGALTGYAGGEASKRFLLDHEARLASAISGVQSRLQPRPTTRTT